MVFPSRLVNRWFSSRTSSMACGLWRYALPKLLSPEPVCLSCKQMKTNQPIDVRVVTYVSCTLCLNHSLQGHKPYLNNVWMVSVYMCPGRALYISTDKYMLLWRSGVWHAPKRQRLHWYCGNLGWRPLFQWRRGRQYSQRGQCKAHAVQHTSSMCEGHFPNRFVSLVLRREWRKWNQ